MNIAVINIKDIVKYVLKLGAIIILIYILMQIVKGTKDNKENLLKKNLESSANKISKNSFVKVLDISLPIFSYENNKEDNDKNIISNKKILAMTSGIFNEKVLENKSDNKLKENGKEDNTGSEEQGNEEIEMVSKDANTESVKQNNIEPSYNVSFNGIKINNQSDYKITKDMVVPDIEIKNKKDILIYHTHTCESYTSSKGYEYKQTGNYRTTDLNYNVVRVGTELTKYLEEKGFNVTHNKTYHDYPSYNGSYERSLKTIQELLVDKDTQFVIDLHRDAVGSSNSYAPSVKVDEKTAAQMLIVLGTDGGGLDHPNWKENLKMAVKIQQKANEMYPGLFRPIIIRNSRYNQHVATGAFIIEVGATGNTLDQCFVSMQCLANIYEEVCK